MIDPVLHDAGPEQTDRLMRQFAGLCLVVFGVLAAAEAAVFPVEAQMMAMANHTRWMGGDATVVYATGGAAGNRQVLQVMADVFGAEVVRSRARNSAALGAALRAWHADALASNRPIAWDDVVKGLTEPDPAWRFKPRPHAVAVYATLRLRYAEAESAALVAS